MKLTPKVYAYIAGVLLILGLIVGAYRRGKAIGETDAKVHQLDSLVRSSDNLVTADKAVADKAVKKADSSEMVAKAAVVASGRKKARADSARERVLVVGDSVDGVPLPDVANLIRVTDSARAQDAFTIELQLITIAQKDSAITALNQLVSDLTQGVKIRDEEIGVLKKAKRPRFGFKTGVVVGVLASVGAVFLSHR